MKEARTRSRLAIILGAVLLALGLGISSWAAQTTISSKGRVGISSMPTGKSEYAGYKTIGASDTLTVSCARGGKTLPIRLLRVMYFGAGTTVEDSVSVTFNFAGGDSSLAVWVPLSSYNRIVDFDIACDSATIWGGVLVAAEEVGVAAAFGW